MNFKRFTCFIGMFLLCMCAFAEFSYAAKAKVKPADDDKAYYAEAVKYYDNADYIKAFDAFQKAAEKGDIRADFQIGVMYLYGKGVAVDDEKAFTAFAKAAEKGNTGATFIQGRMLIDGIGTDKDLQKAMDVYEQAANKGKKGNPFFQYLLGKYYIEPLFVPQDKAKGEKYLVQAAKNGYPQAALLLAEVYETDKYGMKDAKKSKDYYKKAAKLGMPKAKILAGDKAEDTKVKSDNQDSKTGNMWILRKAGEGDAKALYDLALVYDHIKQGKPFDWSRKQFASLYGVAKVNYVKLLNDCLSGLIWLNILVLLLFSWFNIMRNKRQV